MMPRNWSSRSRSPDSRRADRNQLRSASFARWRGAYSTAGGRRSSAAKESAMAFTDKVADPVFDSVLEIPTSGDPSHNAMLTITLRYKLNLADGKNATPGIIVQREGAAKARDGEGFLHSIDDWNDKLRENYKKAIWRAEKIWNLKFMLVPPLDYDGLDFKH